MRGVIAIKSILCMRVAAGMRKHIRVGHRNKSGNCKWRHRECAEGAQRWWSLCRAISLQIAKFSYGGGEIALLEQPDGGNTCGACAKAGARSMDSNPSKGQHGNGRA